MNWSAANCTCNLKASFEVILLLFCKFRWVYCVLEAHRYADAATTMWSCVSGQLKACWHSKGHSKITLIKEEAIVSISLHMTNCYGHCQEREAWSETMFYSIREQELLKACCTCIWGELLFCSLLSRKGKWKVPSVSMHLHPSVYHW